MEGAWRLGDYRINTLGDYHGIRLWPDRDMVLGLEAGGGSYPTCASAASEKISTTARERTRSCSTTPAPRPARPPRSRPRASARRAAPRSSAGRATVG